MPLKAKTPAALRSRRTYMRSVVLAFASFIVLVYITLGCWYQIGLSWVNEVQTYGIEIRPTVLIIKWRADGGVDGWGIRPYPWFPGEAGWSVQRAKPHVDLWVGFFRSGPIRAVSIPVWLVLVTFLPLVAYSLRSKGVRTTH